MEHTNLTANELGYKQIGWKTYNTIIKKAVGQEFSGWTGGLIINLAIAFFIVIISAYALSIIHQTLLTANKTNYQWEDKVYQLETIKYLPILEENYLEYNRIKHQKEFDQRKLLFLKPLLA